MKLSRTTWLIILVLGLAGAYLLMKYLAKPQRSSAYKAVLVDFSEEELTRLRITQLNDTAELIKEGDFWYVGLKNDERVLADTSRISEVIDILQRIRPARMYAKGGNEWPSLQLDSIGIRVEAYEGKEKTLDMVIGRSFPDQGSYSTYVRLFDDSTSYVASNVVSYNIQPHPNEYRSIYILNLELDSIQNISFNDLDAGAQFALQKQDSVWLLQTPTPRVIPTDSLFEYLADIATLSSNNFADNFSVPGSANLSVEVRTSNKTQHVYLYRDTDNWVLQSGAEPSTFFRDSTACNTLWKSSEFFLGFSPQ